MLFLMGASQHHLQGGGPFIPALQIEKLVMEG